MKEGILGLFGKRKRFVLYCEDCDKKLGEDIDGLAETTNQELLTQAGQRHKRVGNHNVNLFRKNHKNGD